MRLDRFANLAGDRQRVVQRNSAARDPVCKGLPFDELEDERVGLAAVLETINRRNVRMAERGKYLRLALEACESIGIECERVGDDLQRDVETELRVTCRLHLAHAAGADGGLDFVRANTRPWGQRHFVWSSGNPGSPGNDESAAVSNAIHCREA